MKVWFWVILVIVVFPACAPRVRPHSLEPGQAHSAAEYLEQSLRLYESAERAKGRKVVMQQAELGRNYATECLKLEPQNAGCYFYRALNTGRYFEAKVFGYAAGLQSMVADAQQVIALEPSYDHAGAYRLLGQIYLQVPDIDFGGSGITRDPERAQTYLNEATRIAPDYPENWLFAAEADMEAGQSAQACPKLQEAQAILEKSATQTQFAQDYAAWQKLLRKLKSRAQKSCSF